MRRTLSLFLVPLALVLLLPASGFAGLISNGGFEAPPDAGGTFPGWTIYNSQGVPATSGEGFARMCDSGVAAEGSCYGSFGPAGNVWYLTQDLVTVPGEYYTLDFFISSNVGGDPAPNVVANFVAPSNWTLPDNQQIFLVGWGTTQLGTSTGGLGDGWQHFHYQVQATGTTTTLTLGFRNDPSYYYLDGVDVNPASSPVPEPATFALLGGGLLGVAFLKRKIA